MNVMTGESGVLTERRLAESLSKWFSPRESGLTRRLVEEMIGRVLLDRYTIRSLLGRGGMSVVYLARDTRLERDVAIKVFDQLSVKDEALSLSREHFVREAFALSELRHPNTLRIFDFAYIEDQPPHVPFQVSEYMDGGTLRDLVRRRGTLSEPNSTAILHALGGALAEAHAHGIVHRDVKPSNILFAHAGKQRIVKLADFSVAFALGNPKPSSKKKKNRTAFYSLGWSAPEQVQHKDVTPTADVYGLGLLLAYMVSGEAPRPQKEHTDFFREPQVLDEKMEEALGALAIPAHLRKVCLTACRAKPEERYRSVEAFLEAMNRARAELRAFREQTPWSEVSSIPAGEKIETAVTAMSPLPSLEADSLDLASSDLESRDLESPDLASVDPALFEPAPFEPAPRDGPVDSIASVASIASIPINLGADHALPGGARVRLTRLPSEDMRIHLRALNCFVRIPGSRLSTAIDLCSDTAFELVSKDQITLASLRTSFADDALYLIYGN